MLAKKTPLFSLFNEVGDCKRFNKIALTQKQEYNNLKDWLLCFD